MADWQRTHTCGELRDTHIGQIVTLNGWVNTYRAYPDQVFVDLRDRYGVTQVVFETDDKGLMEIANSLGREFVLSVTGTVSARFQGKENPKLATGKIEVRARAARVLNACPTPPIDVTEFGNELANEDVRLQYRYLDLRRKTLQDTLIMRHRLCKTIRDYLDERGFLEVETPLLGKSTPEGARDYLVPSRLYHGEWYALPQSPQLYKQILMVAGYDKYFQIAKCLRDEDTRADRQPEFTQLDLEMSFCEMDDIFRVIEGLSAAIFERCLGITIPTPFPRMSYADAMLKYGSDKPDLRYGLEIVDLSKHFAGTEPTYQLFRDAVGRSEVVRAINVKGAAKEKSFTSKGRKEMTDSARQLGAGGLGFAMFADGKVNSPFWDSIDEKTRQAMAQELGFAEGDALVFMTGTPELVSDVLGTLRTQLATQLKLFDPAAQVFKPFWVVDFPSFMFDAEEKRWVALHHPFTSPRDEDLAFLESDPGKVKAKAYDLVMNGYEVGGGSIRIHSPEVQSRVFKMLGMADEDARARFGFLLDALKYGAPPHGGIAFGLDRWAMILAGTTNIRDVIAFPKNAKARDMMTGAPAAVEQRQLKDLGLK
jgi:aspartyl-tRNA synthetase